MSSSFGRIFRISTFGESHCPAVGVVVDGVPPRMSLSEADIQTQLDRRRPGGNKLGTERDEADQVKILSGVENGLTLGTPIGMMVNNRDQRPGDYGSMSQIPRPSHADYTYRPGCCGGDCGKIPVARTWDRNRCLGQFRR